MLDPVTVRYAEALFNLARAQGVLEAVGSDVERLAQEFAKPSVAEFFFDERMSADARREKLRPVISGMHELVQNFVGLLFDKRRETVLGGLGFAFHRRMLNETNAAEGVVESARPMAPKQIEALQASLGARLGKRVTLRNEISPGLIGGVRVIVQSRLIDYSFSGRLAGLRKKLAEAPLPKLETSQRTQ